MLKGGADGIKRASTDFEVGAWVFTEGILVGFDACYIVPGHALARWGQVVAGNFCWDHRRVGQMWTSGWVYVAVTSKRPTASAFVGGSLSVLVSARGG